ncbi:MAG: hypothetical protein F4X89_12180 [Dehalococcoidia bacterium]|nr:hypothetical protein [Chloroflexota bacterium]MXZ88125.1 hypothetical protein [Dehalococcoidia bacterium]MYA54217.1 hypothetical protein [Dehalococcoidia bacterium]
MPEADRYEDYDDYDDEEDDGLVLGPDERDRDLLDGTWEQEYYSTERRPSRDWNAIGVGIALLLLMGMILPTLLFALR